MSSLTCKWEKEEQMAILVSGKYIENHFDITKLKYSACLLIDTPQRYWQMVDLYNEIKVIIYNPSVQVTSLRFSVTVHYNLVKADM